MTLSELSSKQSQEDDDNLSRGCDCEEEDGGGSGESENKNAVLMVRGKEADNGMEEEKVTEDESDDKCTSNQLTPKSEKGSFRFNNVLKMLKFEDSDSLSVSSAPQERQKRGPRNFMRRWGRRQSSTSNSSSFEQSEESVDGTSTLSMAYSTPCERLPPLEAEEDLAEVPAKCKDNRNRTPKFQALGFFKTPLAWRRTERLNSASPASATNDVEEEEQKPIATTSSTKRDAEGVEEESRNIISSSVGGNCVETTQLTIPDTLPVPFMGLLAEAIVGEVTIDDMLELLSNEEFNKYVEHLWGTKRHIWMSEAKHLLESWCGLCGFCPQIMLSSITRCLCGRRERGWLKEIEVRSIIDALVTRTFYMVPGRDVQGRRMLVMTLHSLDYERCAQEQYDKCMSYLLQDAANIHSASRNIRTLRRFPSCEKLVLIIDFKKEDFTWIKVKSLVGNVLGVKYEEDDAGGKYVTTEWATAEGHVFCDPVLSYFPLVLSRVVIVNAGPMAKVGLAARRFLRRSNTNRNFYEVYPSSKGRHNSADSFPLEQPGHSEEGMQQQQQPYQLPISIVNSKDSWIEAIGDEGLQALPECLGGNMQIWNVDLELNHRIQMEDLPQDSLFRSDMARFLQISSELSHASSNESYVNCFKQACQANIAVPVMWVRKSLGNLKEAAFAEAATWKGRDGKGVRHDLVQLQKDSARDEIFVDGMPKITGDDGIELLSCRIKAVADETGLRIPDVKCHLAARDILLSTKRTATGGDMWVCVETLCHNKSLVVICPISKDADGLEISVDFVPGVPGVSANCSCRKPMEEKRPSSLSTDFYRTATECELEGSKSWTNNTNGKRPVSSIGVTNLSESGGHGSPCDDTTQEINEEMLKSRLKLGGDVSNGFISVTARTKMIFKICAVNPLDGHALLILSCIYYRYFSVGPEGLQEGAVPSNLSPLVIISYSLNSPSPINGVPE